MFDLDIPFSMPILFAVVQIVLDLILICIVLFLLRRISAFDPARLAALIDTLKKSEKLCEELDRIVAGKAAIAGNIERILHQSGNNKIDSEGSGSGQDTSRTAGSKREQALALWEQGRTVGEIVDITGLGRGEVEVITALAGQAVQRDR